ncbi:hypothetical protein PFISCL1PPCAC_5807, partial [Pristionchus fissidentatus]
SIPMPSLLQMVLLISLLLITLSTVASFDEFHPILMDRRDAPFGGLLNDLKTQTLGGRMRFGKRSGGVESDSHNALQQLHQWRSQLLNRPL